MRHPFLLMLLLLSPLTSAGAQVSIQIGLPSVSIGINQAVYPQLVVVPGYPVYYDPGSDSNYFFYDGMYWVYERDNWYASSWFNGPWSLVGPQVVPFFILRIPLRYYRHPPDYFRGWHADQPPRWGEHWGHDWERQRGGWDKWDRGQAPAPAPLPVYQRQYSGNRYPQAEQQQALHNQNYRHEPRDAAVKQVYQAQRPAPPAQRAQPAKEAPHAQPAKEAPHAQPAKEAPRAQPAKEAPHAQPAKEAPHAQPAREAPHAQPAKEAPRAQPVREAPHAQPAKEAPRAQPAREAQHQQPARAPEPVKGHQEKDQGPGQSKGSDQGRERDK